jgi:hypothetical protein
MYAFSIAAALQVSNIVELEEIREDAQHLLITIPSFF